MRKNIVKIALGIAVCMSTASCEKFFDVTPLDKIDATTYFANETEMALYTKGILDDYMPSATSVAIGDDAYSDLVATKTSKDFYAPNVWTPAKGGGWSWGLLRRANYMIEKMVRGKDNVDEATYNHYMGVARYWRASLYFDRIQAFSDVPWLDHVPANTDEELYKSQDDREFVMSKVLEDLNFACENCSKDKKYMTDGRYNINKWVALALKARVCLYEGTYRKYNKVNPSTNVAWKNNYETADDLLTEAANAADQIMKSGIFSIYKGDVKKAYRELFTSESFKLSEVIWGRQYNAESLVMNDITWYYNSATYGQMYSPTKDLVDMYLKLDGTPITDDKVSITKEFEDRDWRLVQTVNGPEHTFINLSGEVMPKTPDCTISRTGYAFIKWSVEKEENYSTGKSNNSIPLMRYAEVLLNYAEAKAELGQMTEDIWNSTIGELRGRAGVTNIYPQSANYKADAWLKSYYDINPDNSSYLTNTILEIRRERVTEMIMENGLRAEDIKRWGVGELVIKRYNNQGWRGIYVSADEFKNGFTFHGVEYKFATSGGVTKTQYPIVNTNANSTWSLTEKTSGYLVYNYKLQWDNKMYTSPVPTAAINKNNNLYQNYGWDK